MAISDLVKTTLGPKGMVSQETACLFRVLFAGLGSLYFEVILICVG